MNSPTLVRVLVLLALSSRLAGADTLYFLAQTDINGIINYSWFSVPNWFVPGANGLIPANRLPVPGDTVQLRSEVNAAGNTIPIATLSTGGNIVNGGNFIVNASLQTGDGTTFIGSTLEIQSQWLLSGYCSLSGGSITVEAGAFLQMTTVPSLLPQGLFLSSAQFHNVGQITMTTGTSIGFTGGTNRLDNAPNALITGSGSTLVSTYNNNGAWLTFDNNGRLQSQSGTLEFDCWNVTWTNSLGLGILNTSATNALIALRGPVTFFAGTTNEVLGPGLTRLNGGDLATINGALQIGAVDPATLALDPGTLEVDRDLNGSGQIHALGLAPFGSVLNFAAGNIYLAAVNIDPSAQLWITGPGSVAFWGAVINNHGTTIWTGEGNGFGMFNNATFNNFANALFDARCDASIYGGSGTNDGVFNNAGTFRKSAGTNDTFFWFNSSPGVSFNNTGLVDVQIGRVVLMGGTNSGRFSVTNGATLRFWHSPYSLVSGATFTGGGSFAVGGNTAVLLINGNVTIPNFLMGDAEDSVLDGPGVLTLTGTSSWTGGTIQGPGTLNIASNSTFYVMSGVTLLQRALNNAGNVILTNTYGSIVAGKGAVFNNEASGLLLFQVGNRGFDNTGAGPMPVLNNAGIISNGVGYYPLINWVVTNSNFLLVAAGNFNLQQGYTQTAGATILSTGAVLSVGWTNPCLLQGGTLTGQGEVSGPVVNSATIAVSTNPLSTGGAGVLSFNGGYPKSFTQTDAGVLAVRIGGAQAGQFDQFALVNNGSAVLGGTLAVTLGGYTPRPGDAFPILTYGAAAGVFANVTGNRASNGLTLRPSYGANGVTLVAVNDLALSGSALGGGLAGLSFLTTTGLVYGIEFASSLVPPVQWRTLTNIAGAGTLESYVDPSTNHPQRFYRVSQSPAP